MTTKNRITGCLAAIASMAVVPQASAVLVLSVDLEGDPSNGGTAITEAGFVSLTALGGEAVGATVSTMEAGVNATVGATGGGFLAGRTGIGNDRGGDLSNLTNNDLQGDLIAARGGDGGFTIQLVGLSIGETVTVTAWHNDANGGNSGFATPGNSVTPSITAGGTLISATAGAHNNLSRPATATFSGPYDDSQLRPSIISFTATAGTADLLLQTQGGGNNFIPVSGFTVDSVPEPSTFALVGLGAIGLLRRRRH